MEVAIQNRKKKGTDQMHTILARGGMGEEKGGWLKSKKDDD